MINRCAWAGSDPLYVAYHDQEWGVPLHDDRGLFEFIILEGAQAGLSWATILKKRDTCYACVVRCKRVVEVNEGAYTAEPYYGGPEYETSTH